MKRFKGLLPWIIVVLLAVLINRIGVRQQNELDSWRGSGFWGEMK